MTALLAVLAAALAASLVLLHSARGRRRELESLLAERQQAAPVQRVRRRQLRIHLHGFLQLGLRGGVVLPGEVCDSHQEVRLGGVAGAEDAPDVLLCLLALPGAGARQRRTRLDVRLGAVCRQRRPDP